MFNLATQPFGPTKGEYYIIDILQRTNLKRISKKCLRIWKKLIKFDFVNSLKLILSIFSRTESVILELRNTSLYPVVLLVQNISSSSN